jgi:carboxylesterase type B
LFSHVRPLWTNLGLGSFHGTEMSFVFHDDRSSWRDTDRQLADKMSTSWYQFARDGNPGSVEGTSWPTHTISEDRTLELNGEGISTVEQLRREKCRFWADYSP